MCLFSKKIIFFNHTKGDAKDFNPFGKWLKDDDNDYFYRVRSCKTKDCQGNLKQIKRKRGWRNKRRYMFYERRGKGHGAGWNSKMDLNPLYQDLNCVIENKGKKTKPHWSVFTRKRKVTSGGWAFDWGWGTTAAFGWGALSGIKGIEVHQYFDYDNSLIRPNGPGFGLGLGIDGLNMDSNAGIGDLNWPYGNWYYSEPQGL